jgi:hypothetical protein
MDAQLQNRNDTQRYELNMSKQFCCYVIDCVIIDERSYCMGCAAVMIDDDVSVEIDVRTSHATMNETSANTFHRPYTGPDKCFTCGGATVHVGDAAACGKCVRTISTLYHFAIANGTIDVVTEEV